MNDEEYNELLEAYDNDDYVYIVETCIGKYATTIKPELYYCEFCDCYDFLDNQGYVRELVNRDTIENQQYKQKVITYKRKIY